MNSRTLTSTLLPVGILLVAMTSVQSGASLAKSLFPSSVPRAPPACA